MIIRRDSKVFEKYKVISKIGVGGFSEVYKVEEKNDPNHKHYALKYLKSDGDKNKNEIAIKRFIQEIDIYKNINSRSVIEYHDSFVSDTEQYLVTEFVPGTSIADHLKKEGRIIPKKAVMLAIQIAEGFQELHNNGITHRDLKSNNILINETYNIKIIDLGIALRKESQRYTRVNSVIGTPYYLAPELVDTKNKYRISHKVDIYALGILLYEMLVGEYPFNGSDAKATIKMHLHSQIPDIRQILNVPQALANVITKATAKDPMKRYNSMWEMARDLKTCLEEKRYYEKPLDLNKVKPKKTFADIVNSRAFLISSLVVIGLTVLIIILIAIFINKK
ncbi:MAG: serine/threonine-protein kinase [Metamycoplasmataceae bacterium]